LSKSGIYSQIVDTALNQNTGAEDQEALGSNPQTKQLIGQVFSPQKIQSIVEQVIDGTYHWLEGKTAKPDFVIDLSADKSALASGLADQAIARLQSLPVCRKLPSSSDPFLTDCRVAGINYAAEKEKIRNQLLINPGFLPNTVITADNLPADQNGQSFTQKFSKFPTIFKLIKISPFISALIVGLCATCLIYAAQNKRRGIKIVGNILFWDGAFIFISTVLLGKIFPSFINNFQAKLISGGSNQILGNVLNQATVKIVHATLAISAVVAILGAAIWLAEHFTQPKSKSKIAK
jgi:hypothetical protein